MSNETCLEAVTLSTSIPVAMRSKGQHRVKTLTQLSSSKLQARVSSSSTSPSLAESKCRISSSRNDKRTRHVDNELKITINIQYNTSIYPSHRALVTRGMDLDAPDTPLNPVARICVLLTYMLDTEPQRNSESICPRRKVFVLNFFQLFVHLGIVFHLLHETVLLHTKSS